MKKVQHTIEWQIDVAKILGVILLCILVLMGKDVVDKTSELTSSTNEIKRDLGALKQEMPSREIKEIKAELGILKDTIPTEQIQDLKKELTALKREMTIDEEESKYPLTEYPLTAY